jgi:aminoglycoside 2'-N-acetyltransferase I
MLEEAFAERAEGRFGDADWGHCLGGLHAWVEEDSGITAHAAVVLRRMLHGERVLRCGYVEAVAVRTDRRRSGLGGAVLDEIERLIHGGYEVGVLGATSAGRPLYRSRGWQPWRGFLGGLTPAGIEPAPQELGKIHVLPVQGTFLDLDGPLVCDYREGDLW